MAVPTRLINGVKISHNDSEIDINGTIHSDISEISYSSTLEPGKSRGTAPSVLGRSKGEGDHTCSFTCGKKVWQSIIDGLGDQFMTKEFPITVNQTSAEGNISDKITGCRITEGSYSSSGSDPTMVTVTLHPMDISYNGKAPF